MGYPYYSENTHDRGSIAIAAGNGVRDTAMSGAEERLKLDVSDRIFMLDAAVSPFTAVLTNVGKKPDGKGSWTGKGLAKVLATQPEFKEFEGHLGGRYAKNVGTYSASGALTLTVTGAGSSSAHIFTVGDMIMNARTGERMLVATVGVGGANEITIASGGRAFGTTSAAAGQDGDGLFIIGNANEEFGGARNVNTVRLSLQSNYTQIFKTTVGSSGTENSSELYGGNDLAGQRGDKGIEHARDIERAFLWGEKKLDTSGTMGKPRRTTGGVQDFIESSGAYVQNQNNQALTPSDMAVLCREGFWYGSGEKWLFAGPLILDAVAEIARGQLVTASTDKSYGVVINRWNSPHGVINIVRHPLLVEDFAGHGFLLDLDCFKYRFLRDRDTKLRMNIQVNDADGECDEYLTECGLERVGAPRCAMIKNVSF